MSVNLSTHTSQITRRLLLIFLMLCTCLLNTAALAKQYVGKPMSLNFQDIEVRAVLQLIGDFTETNIVVSDEVSGNITLRLNNVPWDQALDIILRTKGLSYERSGNIIYVVPNRIVAANKQAAYEVENIEKELAPLEQQLLKVKYARAEHLKTVIEKARGKEGKVPGSGGLLSARGSISVDSRTNTLIINDVPSGIAKVRDLVSRLDVAVSQVLIDVRVVAASSDFTHELGIRWGGAAIGTSGSTRFGVSGSAKGAASALNGGLSAPSLSDRLGVNLGASNANGLLGLQILGTDFLLDLELSALEDTGRGEVISSPRVITQDGNRATIKSGTEIPYTVRDGAGTATVLFKSANLALDVTPKIAPNNMIDMILKVDKDTVGAITQTLDGVVPSINTNGITTQVLVENGETIVLGGVFEQTKTKAISKVPVLGDLPIIGRAFRHDKNTIQKSELLIFVTPKIVDSRYTTRNK
ncbi:MAG: hypothetical protein CSA44_00505 [Gammaproteobacteria bacterium]|nr:MAG: hypothetical protein CSA44_00505 [Gammaproteobacteria bacterium]